MRSVSVIIVNYNGADVLEDCLESIQDRIPGLQEIILVDNASTDGSVEKVEECFSLLKVIKSDENLGFARGNNLGVSQASGDIILLLNSDAMLQHSLGGFFSYLESHPEIGVSGVKLRYGDGRLQPSVGYRHTPLRILLEWLLPKQLMLLSSYQLLEKRRGFYDQIHCDIDWVTGAFFVTTNKLWHELGGFDQDIFMYVEDVDYCIRVKEAGYRVCYYPFDEVIHLEGGAGEWGSMRSFQETMRSYKIYLKKHHKNSALQVVVIGLSLIFRARAAIHTMLQWLAIDKNGKKKAEIYMAAVQELKKA